MLFNESNVIITKDMYNFIHKERKKHLPVGGCQ